MGVIIKNLSQVRKPEDAAEKIKELKEFFENKDLIEQLNTSKLKFDKISFELQGSYSRHTATFINKNEKSDIDIILYIGEFNTSNNTQNTKNQKQLYEKNIRNKIKKNLVYEKEKIDIVSLEHFLILKQNIINKLQKKFTKYEIVSKTKCICISTKFFNFDICIAGKWNIDAGKNKYEGANIVVEDGLKEIQSLPKINKENLEAKKEKAEYLYEIIRVIKNLNNLLKEEIRIQSFLIECLLYNLRDNLFSSYPDKQIILNILEEIKKYYMLTINSKNEFIEVNEILLYNEKLSYTRFNKWINSIINYVNTGAKDE